MTWMLIAALILQKDYIAQVKEGELNHNALAPIGLVFEHYQFFESFTWRVEGAPQKPVVVFEGLIPDKKATDDFYEKNRYAFRLGFKAMQLSAYYGLTKDKEMLRYRIRFSFNKEGGFRLTSGELGIRDHQKRWVDKALAPKSLLAVVDGIYTNENPYVSLVKGMPYK